MKDKNKKWRQCEKKKRYRDESEVRAVMRKRMKEADVKLDFYYCTYCKGYHLTHKKTGFDGWGDLE